MLKRLMQATHGEGDGLLELLQPAAAVGEAARTASLAGRIVARSRAAFVEFWGLEDAARKTTWDLAVVWFRWVHNGAPCRRGHRFYDNCLAARACARS